VRDLIVAEDIRNGALTASTEEAIRWNLVTRVFGGDEASKPDDGLKPVMPLSFRWGEGGPIDRSGRDNMGIATRRGKSSEVSQVALCMVKGKPHGTAYRQIRVDGLH
jgi:hypothetical protein